MANLATLGEQFIHAKSAANQTPEGVQLGQAKGAFKSAFMSYLNWGGKWEVEPIEVNTPENKSIRKMNEWALKKERDNEAACILTKVLNVAWNFFTAIVSCFYQPAYEVEKNAYEASYMEIEQSFSQGAQMIRLARAHKHAFKDAFKAASPEEKAAFFDRIAAIQSKAEYWNAKAAQH